MRLNFLSQVLQRSRTLTEGSRRHLPMMSRPDITERLNTQRRMLLTTKDDKRTYRVQDKDLPEKDHYVRQDRHDPV